jgi:uncharacterized protein (TIGR02996 family)
MGLYLTVVLCWVAALVAWIVLVVRGMARATPGEPARPGHLLHGLTLLVCLPFLAVMLPFQVPAILCRGRGRLAFWAVTALYLAFLWSLAVSVLRVGFVEAAVVLSLCCLAYGRPACGACGNPEGIDDLDPGPPVAGDPFLRAIIANPNDHGLRLVYADFLEERGDPRGEFLRVQCMLATLPGDDPRRPGLEARRKELLTRHGETWLGPLLRRYLGGPAWGNPSEGEVRRLAEEYGALPVLFDLGGFAAIRMDGEVVGFAWEELGSPPRAEPHPALRHAALLHGAARFPELHLLIPPRPADGRDCPSCGGRASSRPWRPGPGCFCGGLGWIPQTGCEEKGTG